MATLGYILYIIACYLFGYMLGFFLTEYLSQQEWVKEFGHA
jgi:uncharacterized protein YneF (UPF0154 family)